MSDASTHEGRPQHVFAIVGMAARFPRADTIATFWRNIVEKVDCIGPIPESRRADADAYLDAADPRYIEQGYLDRIDRFDPAFFGFAEKEAELTDPRQRLFVETAFRAFEDAGFRRKDLARSRIAVFLACNGDRDYLRLIERFQPRSAAVATPLNSVAMMASRVSHVFDLTGPAIVVDSECSSSLVALHHACGAIAAGDCHAALVGAVDLNFSPVADAPKLGIESADGRTRAFDDDANGTGNGEGVAAIVVKPLARAIEDRDQICALILGSAINNDGHCKVMTSPSAAAQTEVILEAWRRSGIAAESLAYIEAHGTGTKIGDPIEIAGLTAAFAAQTDTRGFCAISSVKTNIGHLNHAAGLAGLIKAVMALRARVIPPSLHFEKPNRQIDFSSSAVSVSTTPRHWKRGSTPRRCAVSSFGMSGTNCHVVLQEAPDQARILSLDEPFVFTLSAPTDAALRERTRACIALWQDEDAADLANVCYTACVRHDHYERRLALVVRTVPELVEKLRHSLSSAEAAPSPAPAKAIRLQTAMASYLEGKDVDWSGRFTGLDVRVVPFPPVPLQDKRCWISVPDRPRTVSAVEAPRSASTEPQDRSLAPAFVIGRSDGNYSETEIALARVWADVVGVAEINVLADFYELGADSMSFLKIVVKIEQAFHITFQDDFLDFDAFANFQDLVKYVDERAASSEALGLGPSCA